MKMIQVLCFLATLACTSGTPPTPFPNHDQEAAPLYLSPLISSGQLDEARQLSRVRCLSGSDVESYSGYITVDKPACGSHLFFWFFPAQDNPEEAPVILWLNGGPFRSSMYGALIEHGPLQLRGTQRHEHLSPRNVTWAKEHSMLYVDNPVGAGASISTGGCYSRNMSDVSKNLYSFLEHFFRLFGEYSHREFYIGGQSYAGKYVPALGHYIDDRNHDNPDVYIHLSGIFLGAGFCDPETMLPELPEYLYSLGIISADTRDKVQQQIADGWNKPDHNPFYPEDKHYWEYVRYYLGLDLLADIFSDISADDIRAAISEVKYSKTDEALKNYLTKPAVARALHISPDDINANYESYEMNLFGKDFTSSTKDDMAFLMERYKVLYYTGDMDAIVNVRMGEAFLLSTPWCGQAAYNASQRTPWTVGGQLAGFVTRVDNFTRVIVRNAGHLVPTDQPEWALDMIRSFIQHWPGQLLN